MQSKEVEEFLQKAKMTLFGEETNGLVKSMLGSIKWRYYGDRSTAYTKMLSSNNLLLRTGVAVRLRDRTMCNCGGTYHIALSIEDRVKNRILALYIRVCNLLITRGQYGSLQLIAMAGSILPFLYDRSDWISQCEMIAFMSSILSNDGPTSLSFVKSIFEANLDSVEAGNYLLIVNTVAPHVGLQRYIARLNNNLCKAYRNEDNPSVAKTVTRYVLAHFALLSGQYKRSIEAYSALLAKDPHNPLLFLLIGICYLMFVSHRYSCDRSFAYCQAMFYLSKYKHLRGDCQEVHYNIGRAFHQVNMLHLAADSYMRVFKTNVSAGEELFDLKRQAAFNLLLIYKADHEDGIEKSMEILSQYLVV
ncbi:hypothetical protein ACOME3_010047 [Neoechinorhynchus agilis]